MPSAEFYPPSPRFLSLEWRGNWPASAAFVTTVAVFVNPAAAEVYTVLERVRRRCCSSTAKKTRCSAPVRRAVYEGLRGETGGRLLEYLRHFLCGGWLLDSHVEEYGGAGESFDWSLVPEERIRPLVLSGGLTRGNVGEAVRRVRPWAVDVSSGVESARGIKDAARIAAFITEVRNADV